MLRRFLALALASAVGAASAADLLGAPPGTPDNSNIPYVPEWQELEAPPPPPLRTSGLIPIDVAGTSLRFGVDPASITIGKDDVVRYVVVATSSSGAVNGFYEGIHCGKGQVKVYARHNPDSGWVVAKDAEWRDIFRTANLRYSLAIARSGACQENSPNVSPAQIALDLKAPVDRRWQRGGVNR
ncbi:CNP1-like family protein [Ramlibacter sp. USB13]|uniref:CNP1-like family protein n=1 Tax=Ramlibacter cellulosilyticus TaxID=2764187 RepID=A0A923MMN7_9BURK|nr:CNP1-like family protein [Ramlibacter cellulosilyticus]MBC5781928.1 CNP1-like family protein [Ramlibacter cellulosilyticus]